MPADAASVPRSPPRVSLSPWRRWRVTEFAKLALLAGALVWLVLRGAGSMGYNWQWFRVPRYLWRVVDGELIWGPLVKGLIVTLQISSLALVLALAIGTATAILRLTGTRLQRWLARGYLELIRNTPLLIIFVLAVGGWLIVSGMVLAGLVVGFVVAPYWLIWRVIRATASRNSPAAAIRSTGFEELALLSLSSSDYTHVLKLVTAVGDHFHVVPIVA
jgi:hypothetical protein